MSRLPLHGLTTDLAGVAMGRIPADLILENGTLVDVCTARIRKNMDIAVYKGYIALVGDASHILRDENTQVTDVQGKYLCPGLIDSHMHVESSMVDLRSFAAAVLPHGTTTVCPDIHEITNVLGMEALELFKQAGEGLPLKVLTAMPVCVPSLPGMEDAGAEIHPDDVASAYADGSAFLQGEQMNFPGVIFGDPTVHEITANGIKANKILTGHYAGEDLNAGLNAYVASGLIADHETTTPEGAKARAQLGMYVQQRYGTAWLDLPNLIRSVLEDPGMDTRFYTMVTDDVTPATIVEKGHLVRVLRKAISLGMNPIKALQMVTINAAQLLEQSRWIGSLTPGRAADILVVDNLSEFTIEQVYADGGLVAEQGTLKADFPAFDYPESALNTIHLESLTPADFKIQAPGNDPVTARVIRLVAGHVHTIQESAEFTPDQGALCADPERDLAKGALFYRHSDTGDAAGSKGLGFVAGTSFKPGCAYASTVSHDCHNLLVVGMDDEAMALAANTLIQSQGGICIVKEGKVAAHLPLPFGGLMSLEPAEIVARGVNEIEAALKEIGCPHDSFEMTMSLLGLVVLGELRLSNRGLVELMDGPPALVDLILS